LPSGWITKTQNQAEWGWPVLIFPYTEEQSLYDALQVEERRLWDVIRDPSSRHLVQTHLAVFRCPADDSRTLLPGGDSGSYFSAPFFRHFHCAGCPDSPRFEVAASNYLANNGLYDARHTARNNGLFYGNSKVELKHVTDGASKTFAFGERDSRCRAGAWCGVRNPPGPDMWGSYFVRARVSVKLNDPRPVELLGSNTCTEGFSGAHPGGGNFVFLDGSVHFISNDISFNNGVSGTVANRDSSAYKPDLLGAYQRLGIRDDQRPLGEISD
jgi:prepilin-type processing-associated H-X9-DG protein